MATKKRDFKVGFPYHIYNRGNKKDDVFLDDNDYDYFINLLLRYSVRFKVTIVAYCLMPNHYHLLCIPTTPTSLSRMMQNVGTAYHYYCRKKYKIVGHIFQSRYNAKPIMDIAYLNTVIEYIKQNPVEANICQDFHDYPWGYLNEQLVHILPQILRIMLSEGLFS